MSFSSLILPIYFLFSFAIADTALSQSVTVFKSEEARRKDTRPNNALSVKEVKSSYGDFKSLAQKFKSNPLSTLSQEQAEEIIKQQFASSFWQKFFQKFPNAIKCLAAILIDPQALPSAFQILASESKLKSYATLIIFLQVLVLLVVLFFFRMHSPFKRFFYRGLCVFSLQAIGVGYFYFLFKEELTPILKILKIYFFT
ncbi:MAG: hypothetical protein QE271_02950 [Bacteriovoracaceae bacterium]|nr:hypothetical protein [Bacteriovoracaceae bacterium]